MVGHFSCLDDATIACDDVSAEDDECGFGDRACGIERFFPPVPPLGYYVGVESVLVGVEVVYEQDVGTYGILAGATW